MVIPPRLVWLRRVIVLHTHGVPLHVAMRIADSAAGYDSEEQAAAILAWERAGKIEA